MKTTPQPIGEVLKNVFHQIEREQKPSHEEMEKYWEECAGEAALRHSKPFDFQKKVLVVRVDSSVWMQELTMQKRKILKGLQRTLGKDRISEIHFKIGELECQK